MCYLVKLYAWIKCKKMKRRRRIRPVHFGIIRPAYSRAHGPVGVRRCGEHDGFDKKAKHTPSLEFYLQGNPGRVIWRCKQSFYIWLRQGNITAVYNTEACLSFQQVKSGLGAGNNVFNVCLCGWLCAHTHTGACQRVCETRWGLHCAKRCHAWAVTAPTAINWRDEKYNEKYNEMSKQGVLLDAFYSRHMLRAPASTRPGLGNETGNDNI